MGAGLRPLRPAGRYQREPAGADPMLYVRNLSATAEVVEAPIHPSPAATPEETEIILRWLEAPGVRIVEMDGSWSCPVGGAGGVRMLLDERRPSDVAPFDRDLARRRLPVGRARPAPCALRRRARPAPRRAPVRRPDTTRDITRRQSARPPPAYL